MDGAPGQGARVDRPRLSEASIAQGSSRGRRGDPLLPSGRRGRAPTTDAAAITAAARQLLVEAGVEAVTLRAVARALGVTAPALYTYVDSREEMLALLGSHLRRDAVAAIADARDTAPPHPGARMLAACRAFRRWALDHPAEFGVAFGQPRTGSAGARYRVEATVDDGLPAGVQFAGAFASVYAELWATAPFPHVPDGDLDPAFAAELARYRDQVGLDGLPLDVVRRFLGGWVRIFGMVAVEVFGHISYALEDVEPLFEAELADLVS